MADVEEDLGEEQEVWCEEEFQLRVTSSPRRRCRRDDGVLVAASGSADLIAADGRRLEKTTSKAITTHL